MIGLDYMPGWLLGDFRKSKEYKLLNALEYGSTIMELINSRLDTFKWNNLPIGVDSRTLEMALLFRGFACLFTLDNGKTFQVLPASPSENINQAGNWLYCYVYGANGFNKKIKLYLPGISENWSVTEGLGSAKVSKLYNGVLCRENATGYPFIYYIILAGKRLANTARAMDTAIEVMKVPYLIKCDESLKESINGLFSRVRDNEPLVISSKGLDLQAVEVLNTKVDPQILGEFREHYNFLSGNIKEKMGVFHNDQPDKNAHILEDELHASDTNTENEVNKCLTYRMKFCEEANEAFGLNISVELRNRNITTDEMEGFEYAKSAEEAEV